MAQSTVSIRHRCKYRRDDTGMWNKTLAYWLLPTHFVLVFIFSISLLQLVHGRQFLIDAVDTKDSIPLSGKGWLYQSNLSTLVSIVLTVIRTLAGSWLTLTGWRMAFITLERDNTMLGTFDKLIWWRIPPLRWSRSVYGSTTFYILLWLIFIFATPAQFIAPLVTGSITWNPSTYSTSLPSEIAITTAGPSIRWDWFNMYSRNRQYIVYEAAGLASIAPISTFNQSSPSFIRRKIPSILDIPSQSTLKNLTMPLLVIHSLTWVTDISQTGDDESFIIASFMNDSSGNLNISSLTNPFADSNNVGALTILNESPWVPEPYANGSDLSYAFPKPATYLATRWLVLRFNRWDIVHPYNSCSDNSAFFGTTRQQDVALYATSDSCYAIARIEFTAGSTICKACSIVSEGVVEVEFQDNIGRRPVPLPDPLAETAISLMPEVLAYMTIMNLSLAPTWDNLDGYTRGMLSVAYQASWNGVTNDIQPADPTFTTVSTITAVLTANIIKWRIFLWLALNTLLTLSGAILAFLQTKGEGKTIRNPALTALMLDTSGIIGMDECGLCNAVALNSEDCKRRIRLVMSGGKSYRHPLLLAEGFEEDFAPLIPLETSNNYQQTDDTITQ